jgi:hypothetical protein
MTVVGIIFFAPLVNFFLPGFFSPVFLAIGLVMWAVAFAVALGVTINYFGWGAGTCEKVHSMDSYQTARVWLQAIHEKICPAIIIDDEEDDWYGHDC